MNKTYHVQAEGVYIWGQGEKTFIADEYRLARDAADAWNMFRNRHSAEIRWMSISVTEVKRNE